MKIGVGSSPMFLLIVNVVFVVFASSDYIHQQCSSITSCSDCTNSVNSGLIDFSKCVSITPSLDLDETSKTFMGKSLISCASWNSVQKYKYEVSSLCNNESIPPNEQSQIDDLRSIVPWAFYAFSANASDPLLSDLKIFEDTTFGTRVVMGYEPTLDLVITSFRGSDNTMNWIEDGSFVKISYTRGGCLSCQVHTGFLLSYNTLAGRVNGYLPFLTAKYSSARVVVTGHSLGGAQAVLGALDQALNGHNVHLYTYGAPRVGDSNFANFLNGKVTQANLRAVYLNDPVPNLPPITLGFLHGGTEIHFYNCTTYIADPAFADDGQIFDLKYEDQHGLYHCIDPSASIGPLFS